MLVFLVFLLTLCTGSCPLSLQEKYVKAGDIVALYCGDEKCDRGDTITLWKKGTDQETYLYSNVSVAEQREMGLLVFGNCLVILNASVNHQGNYSCNSNRNISSQLWFMVTVYSTQSEKYEGRGQYPITCYRHQNCKLFCPHDLAADISNITSRNITWSKDGEPSASEFPSVEEKDSGLYTCTRSYMHFGEIYKMTFTIPLTVKKETIWEYSRITSPQDGHAFPVQLGTRVQIHCDVHTSSCTNLLFWLSDGSFVDDSDQSPVFYSELCNSDTKKMRASIIFKEVSEEDLSKNYTCKFQSDAQPAQWVTVTLTQKALPSYTSLAVCAIIALIIVIMVMAVIMYVKFKVCAIHFLRGTHGDAAPEVALW